MKRLIMMGCFITLSLIQCGDNLVTGSPDVKTLSSNIEITDTRISAGAFVVEGTVENTSKDTWYPTWYVEADFYADDTYKLKFGGHYTSKTYSLAPKEKTLFEITFIPDQVMVADYPNFAVKNLRAYSRNND